MGQKVHPTGFRMGINKPYKSESGSFTILQSDKSIESSPTTANGPRQVAPHTIPEQGTMDQRRVTMMINKVKGIMV